MLNQGEIIDKSLTISYIDDANPMDPDVVKKTNSLQSVYLTQVLTNNPENVLLREMD